MRCVSSSDPHSNYVHCHMIGNRQLERCEREGVSEGVCFRGFVREYIARVCQCVKSIV